MSSAIGNLNSFGRSRRARGRRSGFTLMEVLVTTVLVSIAVVGVMGGISAVERGDAKAQTAELLQRLASEKMNDLTLLTSPTAGGTSGDFTDRGYPNITWSVEDDSTNVTNLDQVTVTATRGTDSQAITTEMFVRPLSTTGTTSTTSGSTSTGTTP